MAETIENIAAILTAVLSLLTSLGGLPEVGENEK